mgnify:CR=1 FL=1
MKGRVRLMADVLLKTEKLSRKFAQGNTGNTVLNEVDIEIYQDDFTYINELGAFCAPRLNELYSKIIQYM